MTINEARQRLSDLAGDIPAIVSETLEEITMDAMADLISMWPVDTGDSASSFKVEMRDAHTAVITSRSPYAEYVHPAGSDIPIVQTFDKYLKSEKRTMESRLSSAVEAKIVARLGGALK